MDAATLDRAQSPSAREQVHRSRACSQLWRIQLTHAIIFEHADFRGAHKHVFQAEDDLGKWWDNSMDEQTSSVVIVEGNWTFFKEKTFNGRIGPALGPGKYPNVESALGAGSNDRITSLRPT